MVSKITSSALNGVEGYIVDVEVDISRGLPAFDIVGLPDSAVKESKERVRAAIKNSGYEFPVKHITVNLAPADTKKEGPSFDLPIAVGILSSIGLVDSNKAKDVFFAGELSLDGAIKPVRGVLPMVHNAFKSGIKNFILPAGNAYEAALVKGANVYAMNSLLELVGHFDKKPAYPVIPVTEVFHTPDWPEINLNFSDVRGQNNVKRALEVAASGYHNIIMIGPPGSGKTMMAKRLPTIMPPLDFEESIEVTKIYSVCGLVDNKNSLITKRPFRAPHHTISYAALTGGGRIPRPGEISLSHKGVLFLDELPEFHRNVLEVMRQPLEEKSVTISRAAGTLTYPCDFMLVAAMNPCPCGNLYNANSCTCTPNEVSKYLSKISGPLLDRIDIQVETSRVNYNDIRYKTNAGESSQDIKKRVLKTLAIQKQRYKDEPILYNSQLTSTQTDKYCVLDDRSHEMLKAAFDSMNLSVRAYQKILKMARTIADMDSAENISPIHLSEAIQYRGLDRKYWGL